MYIKKLFLISLFATLPLTQGMADVTLKANIEAVPDYVGDIFVVLSSKTYPLTPGKDLILNAGSAQIKGAYLYKDDISHKARGCNALVDLKDNTTYSVTLSKGEVWRDVLGCNIQVTESSVKKTK